MPTLKTTFDTINENYLLKYCSQYEYKGTTKEDSQAFYKKFEPKENFKKLVVKEIMSKKLPNRDMHEEAKMDRKTVIEENI